MTVTPGPHHLQQMRPVLSGDSQRKASERLQRRAEPPVEAAAARRVQFELQLDASALRVRVVGEGGNLGCATCST